MHNLFIIQATVQTVLPHYFLLHYIQYRWTTYLETEVKHDFFSSGEPYKYIYMYQSKDLDSSTYRERLNTKKWLTNFFFQLLWI